MTTFLTTFLTTKKSPIFYISQKNLLFMENQINKDIGDEIICKLKELIEILRRKNEKERTHTPDFGDLNSSEAERKSE
mgnify:FL=1